MIHIFILILILNYKRIKSMNILQNTINSIPNKQIKLLTFNCQRLPYLFRSNIDIDKLMNEYDIVCLQENFCSIFGTNKIKKYNCIHPSGLIYKFVDSGLTIYSKHKIDFIGFIRFNNLKNIDILADKGFLIIKIKDIYVINTHLQGSYTTIDNPTAQKQLESIINYVKNMEKVLICGDLNIQLNELNIPNYNTIAPPIPTHWENLNMDFLSASSAEEKPGMVPCYFDGGIYKNINITNTIAKKIDNYSDHLGVSFLFS
jgi:exonuclease III